MPGEMLDEDTGEAFERAEHGAMNHHRGRLLAVRPDKESAEAARKVEIDLRRAALPFAPDCIAQGVFELWAVESAFARIDGGLGAASGERLEDTGQGRLGPLPGLVRADTLFRPRRQFDDDVFESEIPVDGKDEVVDLQALLHDLILGAKNMRVVLGEGAHPDDAVDRAGRLVAVDDAEFGDLHRQVAIGFEAVLEDLHVAGTIHRLQGEDAFILGLGDEHVLAKRLPMSGSLPERAVEHLRGIDLDVAEFALPPPHIGNQRLKQGPSLRLPENGARPFSLKMEQIHSPPQAAMIPPLCLLELL